jgi:hypothetical protein
MPSQGLMEDESNMDKVSIYWMQAVGHGCCWHKRPFTNESQLKATM